MNFGILSVWQKNNLPLHSLFMSRPVEQSQWDWPADITTVYHTRKYIKHQIHAIALQIMNIKLERLLMQIKTCLSLGLLTKLQLF